MSSRPVDPWTVFPAVVLDVRHETPGVSTYSIQLSDRRARADYSASPGQFNMLYVPGVGEAAISLSRRSVNESPLTHTVRSVGNVTGALAAADKGFSLGIRGPFGTPWPIETAFGHDLILVAGGIGLAPLRPVVDEIIADRSRFGRVTLLIGARTPADLLYTEEYETWASASIDVQTTVDQADPDWDGQVGVVTLVLDRVDITDSIRTVMFVCGPEVMMSYCVASVRRRRVPRKNLWLSLEPQHELRDRSLRPLSVWSALPMQRRTCVAVRSSE